MKKYKEKHPDKLYYSSRGVNILDFMETYGEISNTPNSINIKSKLHQLKIRFPTNVFYKSLWGQKNKLSKKQIGIIEKDYRIKLNKK